MTDGISITGIGISYGVVSAVTAVISYWITARYTRTKIAPQPLEVRSVLDHTVEQLKQNRDDHSNLFSRLSHSEQRISALEASARAQGKQLDRIDTKLDRVLEKLA